jgi:peptidoglycan/xylan/chitin deacetylase (PgdA/CDA1 family)
MLGYILRGTKSFIELFCAFLYTPFLLLKCSGPLRTVLYYHGIAKKDLACFSKQMAYLAQNCTVVQPSKIKTANPNGTSIIVAITFDDAFTSIIENAVPILKEHGLPAGVFVPVGHLGKKPRWNMSDDCSDRHETVMNADQIVELDKKGFEVFSHTVSHSELTTIDDDTLRSELFESKGGLEKIVGHEVQAISYPHGAYTKKVTEMTRKAGYRLGFTIEPIVVSSETDNLRIGRFCVSPADGLMKFRLKVKGAYQITYYLRMMKNLILGSVRSGVHRSLLPITFLFVKLL